MPKAHIAAAMGVSRRCVKKWIDRFAEEGEAGLHDRSSRRTTMPTKTPPEVERRIVELRRTERRGPDWLGPNSVSRLGRCPGSWPAPDAQTCAPGPDHR